MILGFRNLIFQNHTSKILLMKQFILFLFLISPLIIFGHNPLSARYSLKAGVQASILNINLSQVGINQLLLKKYGVNKLNQINSIELKELIVDYIKNNFHFSINEKAIPLKNGGIRLGNHQTDLRFMLPAIANDVEDFFVHIPAFQENNNHQTIFSYQLSGKQNRVILGKKNNYQASVNLAEKGDELGWSWRQS